VIDASLIGPLPASARPDLSVDGTIELERLPDVLKVGRPAFGQAFQTVKMFVLTPDGTEAHHRTVKLGANSVSTIQILEGLREGEQVIISDTSGYDSYDRVRIR
jgi:HlyD family secretion protein